MGGALGGALEVAGGVDAPDHGDGLLHEGGPRERPVEHHVAAHPPRWDRTTGCTAEGGGGSKAQLEG